MWGLILLCVGFLPLGVAMAQEANPVVRIGAQSADFGSFKASKAVRENAERIMAVNDNRGQPFIIVDKVAAQVVAFDASGHVLDTSSALLGLALGDNSVPGIGKKKLRDILPQERTTPAGRFEASLDKNIQGHDILWVDYDASISLHSMVAVNPAENRAARLASPLAADKRISYGCINVPARFFRQIVVPLFRHADGIVYVLPETNAWTKANAGGLPAAGIVDEP
ncbi:MAG: hypothetical protein NVSMB6_09740 [Burkholderiaceae bacterium]